VQFTHLPIILSAVIDLIIINLTRHRILPTENEDGTRVVDGSRAGIVSITSRTPDLITAEYLNLVSVIREGTSYHKYPSLPWTEGEVEHGERSPCQGEWIGEEIEWCIT